MRKHQLNSRCTDAEREGEKPAATARYTATRLDLYTQEIIELLDNGAKLKFIADRYDTATETLRDWLRKHQLQRRRVDQD